MRKTSQDGGDSTSIASGFENELRKTSVGIIKTKRTSIKRKVQNFSLESDDTVIEPLLQVDKSEAITRSAKCLSSKPKTEPKNECESNNLLLDSKNAKMNAKAICIADTSTSSSTISNSVTTRTLHNHMNTNVFGDNGSTAPSTVKSPILVEINGGRSVMHTNQTSSIFTTAKITSDNIMKTMEPIQVTPVPILSTVEVNVTRSGISLSSGNDKQTKSNALSSGSDILKVGDNQINQLSKTQHSDLSKPSTSGLLNKSGNMTEGKSTNETLPKSDLLTKSYDIKKNIDATATVDSETSKKIISQTQSSINITFDKKHQSVQDTLSTELSKIAITSMQSQQQTFGVRTVTGVEGNILKQSISTVKTILPQEVNVTKEAKCSTGSIKQLQRQKNAVLEDPRESSVHANKNKGQRVEEIKKNSLNACVPKSKSHIQVTQSIVSRNLDTVVEKPTGDVSSLVTNTKLTSDTISETILKSNSPVQENVQSKSLVKKDSPVCLTETTNKDIAFKSSTVQASQTQGSLNLAAGSQINKFKNENSLHSVTATDIDSKSSSSLKKLQSSASMKSELVKDSKKLSETLGQPNKSAKPKDTSIEVATTKIFTNASDSCSKSVNNSATTCATASKEIAVSSISYTVADIKQEDKSTVPPAHFTAIEKAAIKIKSAKQPSNTESAAVLSKSETCSSAGSSKSMTKATLNSTSSTTVTISPSSRASQKMDSNVGQSEKQSKKK